MENDNNTGSGQAPQTTEQRLDNIENNIQRLSLVINQALPIIGMALDAHDAGLAAVTDASNTHQQALVHVNEALVGHQEALVGISEALNTLPEALQTEFASTRAAADSQFSQLREVINIMRGDMGEEFDEDDLDIFADDEDDSLANDNIIYDLEARSADGDPTIMFATEAGEVIGLEELLSRMGDDSTDNQLVGMVQNATTDEDDEYVGVYEDMVRIEMPSRPEIGDMDAIVEYDQHLITILGLSVKHGLVTTRVADILNMGITGDMAVYEPGVMDELPVGELPYLLEAMVQWRDENSSGSMFIPLDDNVELSIMHIVMFATLTCASEQVVGLLAPK